MSCAQAFARTFEVSSCQSRKTDALLINDSAVWFVLNFLASVKLNHNINLGTFCVEVKNGLLTEGNAFFSDLDDESIVVEKELAVFLSLVVFASYTVSACWLDLLAHGGIFRRTNHPIDLARLEEQGQNPHLFEVVPRKLVHIDEPGVFIAAMALDDAWSLQDSLPHILFSGLLKPTGDKSMDSLKLLVT